MLSYAGRTCQVLVCVFVLTCFVQASVADEAMYRAKRSATSWGKTIVNKYYDFGANIQSAVTDAAYSEKSGILWAKISIAWKGPFTGDSYAVRGEVEINRAGTMSWKPTWANGNLMAYMVGKEIGKSIDKSIKEKNAKLVEQERSMETLAAQKEAKRVAAERKAKKGTIYAADLKPQFSVRYPSGYYTVGKSKVSYHWGVKSIPPVKGYNLPFTNTVNQFAKSLKSNLHLGGSAYHYTVLSPNQVVVLKYRNLTKNTYGYVAIYRTKDGKFYSHGNGSKWKELELGDRTWSSWNVDTTNKVYIDYARPNANFDKRQIDYRFRTGK